MPNHKKLLSAILASLVMTTAAPALADVKDGVDAWGRGDYSAAVKEWRGPAASGDADAQFNLAQAYKLGRGVEQNLGEAEKWYQKAAKQGHLQASDNYGLILFQNNRRTEALPYLQASADRGEPRAQYVLGTGHFNGDFVPKDYVRAYALMTRASASGLPQATSNIAQMDKYIPIEDRRRAIALAGEMEQQEQRVRTTQIGGLRPAQPSGPIQTAQLPPSQVGAPYATAPDIAPPAPAPAPVRPPVTPPPVTPPPVTPPPVVAPVATAAAPIVAPATGKWRVQLGAFSDQNKAKSLWNTLEGRVSALASLQPYLVNTGKITRLQAGPFATKAQADAMCGKVKASGNACIVRSK